MIKTDKCEVCKKKLSKNDYYNLCKRCQPPWQAGRRFERNSLLREIKNIFKGE